MVRAAAKSSRKFPCNGYLALVREACGMNAFRVIALAGLVCGALDLLVTSTLFKLKGGAYEKLFQFIASGALGAAAFTGGKATAAAGVLFHFFIACSVAAVYYAASLRLNILLMHVFFSGIVYGAAVHLVMSLIVVPLSAAPKRAFSLVAFFTQLVVHMFFVGLPIAYIVARFS